MGQISVEKNVGGIEGLCVIPPNCEYIALMELCKVNIKHELCS